MADLMAAVLVALIRAASAGMRAMLVMGAAWAAAPAHAQPAAPAQAKHCGAEHTTGPQLSAGAVQAWWQAEPAPLQVGQAFALLVTLCPAQARLLRVDAHMPEHRHGMNYRPTLQPLGDGRWRAQGLLWHMPGRWELVLETALDDQRLRLTQTVHLR